MDFAHLKLVVERLRQPPFDLELDAASFDEQPGEESLAIVQRVIEEVDESQKKNLTKEPREETASRIMAFVGGLNFRTNLAGEDFRLKLMQGEQNVVVAVLHHLLQDLPSMKKRAYLARYLKRIEVPTQFAADPDVLALSQEIDAAMDMFKQNHRAVVARREDTKNPQDMQKEISQLNMESATLESKIENAQKRVESFEGYKEIIEAVGKQRQEQVTATTLSGRLREQERQLKESKQRLEDTAKRHGKVMSACRGGDPTALLSRLEEDVQLLKDSVENQMPQNLSEKLDRQRRLQVLMDKKPSDEAIANLQSNIDRLQGEVSQLMHQQQKHQQPADRNLLMYRQQAATVAKKKKEMHDKMKLLENDKRMLESELNDKRQEAAKKGDILPRGAEWREIKRKAAEMRQRCVEAKKILSELRAEQGVLQRTETLLRGRLKDDTAFESFLKKRGTSTAGDTEMFSGVTDEIVDVNEKKAMALEELSQVVKDLEMKIKSRKSVLAPLIKELRELREQFQGTEQEYLQKKKVFENTAVGLESDKNKVESEVQKLTDQAAEAESQFHLNNSMLTLIQAQANRIQPERGAQHDPTNGRGFKEIYQRRNQELENLSSTLRERQREVKDGHEDSLSQRNYFKDLKRLLEAKLSSLREEQMQFDGAQDIMHGAANVLSMN